MHVLEFTFIYYSFLKLEDEQIEPFYHHHESE